ncbi:MAG: hypothetical protein WAW07_05520 [Bacteroidales bacterium]
MLCDDYRFSDFTLDNYLKLLKKAKKNFNFVFFSDFNDQKNILLRHDIDVSIQSAGKMARIEENLGIRSTYFTLVHSEFYNLLDKPNLTSLRAILSMGHAIGLHFDSHFYDITNLDELRRFLNIDKCILEDFLGIKVKDFSFHINDNFTLSVKEDVISGMVNVYSDKYMKNIAYCSDSMGYWRYDRLEDMLESCSGSFQLLIHPCWWQAEILPPRRRIFKIIDKHGRYLKNNWDKMLFENRAKNIDWDKVL